MPIDEAGELAAALPGYEIGGELGRGAFGVVMAGRHRRLGRQVAIKRLPRFFSDHPEVRHRFSSEAKVLASLDHPHIVPIFDYVEQGGLCVLVMELLPGGTVRHWQASGLSGPMACAIALATCSALDYAHQRGVLHRDVKPDNLMFTSAGLLKVTDFGIAKVVGDAAVTRIGETPGTPMYMAPEQCLDQPLGPATDVYSTGVMLYELLAGRHPFAGSGEAVTTMYRQVHEEAVPLHSVVGGAVPKVLSPIVMRALAKDPSARYQSARTFGGALAEGAAAAWAGMWPSGEALRVMSVGPIEAATGWPLTSGPGAAAFPRAAATLPASATHRLIAPPPRPLGPPSLGPPPVGPVSPGAVGPPPAPVGPPPMASVPWAAAQAVPTQVFPTPGPVHGSGPPPQVPRPPESPPLSGRRGRPLAAVMIAVLVAIVLVGGLVALLTNRGGSSGATTTTTVPARANPAQVATDLSRLIQLSAAARTQVVGTVASVENCSADLTAAATSLTAAVTTRQQVVNQLRGLPVDALPNGVALRLAMTNALSDSFDADRHFQAWVAGIQAAGGCTGQARHDSNWQAAQASSSSATGAKQTFAALWNPVATAYGLPKVSSSTI